MKLKRVTFLMALFCLFAVNTFAQMANRPSAYGGVNLWWLTDIHEDELTRKYYACVNTYYKFETKFGKNIVGELDSESISIYDTKGFLKQKGSLKYENKYTKDGRITERDVYSNNGLYEKHVYTYNKDGAFVTCYYSNGNEKYIKHLSKTGMAEMREEGMQCAAEYNSRGRIKRAELQMMLGIFHVKNTYNGRGSLLSEVMSGYFQDRRNRPVLDRSAYPIPDNVKVYEGYQYDAEGNWIKRFYFENGEPQHCHCRKIFKTKAAYDAWYKAKQAQKAQAATADK